VPPFAELVQLTYTFHLWLVGKRVVDFLLVLIRLHGTAMPKELYFTAIVFLSYFFPLCFRRLIFEVTERILTKLGHTFTYDCYLKNLVRTPRARARSKTAFIGLTLNLNRTCLCNGTWYQQSVRNLSIYRTLLHAPTFGELWSRNGWEGTASFCLPLKFSHSKIQFKTIECRAGSRWALPCI